MPNVVEVSAGPLEHPEEWSLEANMCSLRTARAYTSLHPTCSLLPALMEPDPFARGRLVLAGASRVAIPMESALSTSILTGAYAQSNGACGWSQMELSPWLVQSASSYWAYPLPNGSGTQS